MQTDHTHERERVYAWWPVVDPFCVCSCFTLSVPSIGSTFNKTGYQKKLLKMSMSLVFKIRLLRHKFMQIPFCVFYVQQLSE